MPYVEMICTNCGATSKRHHNARKCSKCSETALVPVKERTRRQRDHDAMNAIRALGIVVQPAACYGGKFVAWAQNDDGCHYDDDPAVAVLKAAEAKGNKEMNDDRVHTGAPASQESERTTGS